MWPGCGNGVHLPHGKDRYVGASPAGRAGSTERMDMSMPHGAGHAGHEWQRGTFPSGTAARGGVAPPSVTGVEKRGRVSRTAPIVKVLLQPRGTPPAASGTASLLPEFPRRSPPRSGCLRPVGAKQEPRGPSQNRSSSPIGCQGPRCQGGFAGQSRPGSSVRPPRPRPRPPPATASLLPARDLTAGTMRPPCHCLLLLLLLFHLSGTWADLDGKWEPPARPHLLPCPWDLKSEGLPAPHPPWALASSPLLVPWLHISSLAGRRLPQVGAGGGSWGCQRCREPWRARRSLQP